MNVIDKYNEIKLATDTLQFHCHNSAREAGWWHNITTGRPVQDNPLAFSNKLMLIVSEISEAMEADRKGLMDDKLPDMDGRTVELADALIRIFDLAGAYKLDLPAAMAAKMEYNESRYDHKKEVRQGAGGKAY